MEPVIRPGDTEAEELAQHHLQRVGLQVDQKEQQLVRVADEGTMPPSPRPALAGLTSGSTIRGVGARRPSRMPAGDPGTRRVSNRSSPETVAAEPIMFCRLSYCHFTISEKV